MITDDRGLLDELRHLSQTLGSFVEGIFADSLSVAEQLDFGEQLINVATRIRGRVEQQPCDNPQVAESAAP